MNYYWIAKSNNKKELSILGNDITFLGLTWIEAPPTKPGWYWIWIHHPNTETATMLFVNKNLKWHRDLPYDNEGEWVSLSEFCTPLKTSWLGPLPIPDAPEKP